MQGPDFSHDRSCQSSPVAEQGRGDGDLAVGRHHADDDGLSAGGEGRERGRGQARVTDGFESDVDPLAAAGGLGMGLNRVLMVLLGLESIRDATFLFRGPNRLTP